MLQGLNLIAQVAFLTNRGGLLNGSCTLGDTPTHPTVGPAPAPAHGTNSYKCLVSGSTQTGAPPPVAAGRYSCQLGDGNDDIDPGDLVVASNVTDGFGGLATGAWCKVTRTGPSVYEVDVYTVFAGAPVLTDSPDAALQQWQVNVCWFRLDPH